MRWPVRDSILFHVLIIVSILSIIGLCWIVADATENIPRWAIDNRLNDWRRYDELPLVKVRFECAGIRTGECGKLLSGFAFKKAAGFDLWTGRKFQFMQNENGCYFELFQYDYGSDGNPHFDEFYWIDCEALNELLWNNPVKD